MILWSDGATVQSMMTLDAEQLRAAAGEKFALMI
jgi:hypothetical protein